VTGLPTYAELCARQDAPAGTAWGVFGSDDQLGSLNLLTSERVVAAGALVCTGDVFSLNWPVEVAVNPAVRPASTRHQTVFIGGLSRDDSLDGFALQGTSQWDALRHWAHPDHGFYNGVPASAVDEDGALGIHVASRRGIAGRGVVVGVAAHAERRGTPLDMTQRILIGPDLLDATIAEQGVALGTGDLLLLRTGWSGWYLGLPEEDRPPISAVRQPGLEPTENMAAWVWDHHLGGVIADNVAVEAFPMDVRQALHSYLIACFGMALGELWWLDDLATACAADGHYEALVVVAPLNVWGGCGSPANAVAIR